MSQNEMIQTTYREAVREAIREALQRDERVFLLGEDVARYRWLLRGQQRVLEDST